jgi:tRNA A37 threonylcarbamoyladenosine synthetase subunit TsaC/SUA5/YrdC
MIIGCLALLIAPRSNCGCAQSWQQLDRRSVATAASTISRRGNVVKWPDAWRVSMTAATLAETRLTSDPVPPEKLRADTDALFAALDAGGIGIVPLDVAYAVVATSAAGVRRIFEVKRRSYDKPSGMFGNWRLSHEIHRMEDSRHAMVRELIEEEQLPFSVVAPFRAEHALLAAVEPFVIENSSKAGTLDMLLNAGQFHDAIAEASIAKGRAVFGSSANLSLAGSKYRLADIEAPVRAAAAILFDYGQSKFANADGLASTIIDFRDFTVVRVGHCFERLKRAFVERFGVVLKTA